MADVSKFNILGELVNVKDEKCRLDLDMLEKKVSDDEKNYSRDKSEIIVLGDSISQGWLSKGSYSINAPHVILGVKLDKNVHNYGVNASGYTIVNNSFSSQANKAVSDNSYDHNKVFAIFIIGGVNDLNNDEVTFDVIRNNRDIVINILSNEFKGVPIYLIPTYSANILSVQREFKLSALTSKITVKNSCAVICKKLALWTYNNASYVSSDYIHFTDEGYNIYANDIVSVIFGGDCGSFIDCYKEIKLNGAFNGTLYLCRNDKTVTFYTYCNILKNLDGSNNKLCSLPELFFPDFGITLWSVPIRINKKDNSIGYVTAEIKPSVLSEDGSIFIVGDIKAGDSLWINVSIPITTCF